VAEYCNAQDIHAILSGMVSDAMPYADAVARNVTAARARQRLSQEQVAEAMRDLGFGWVRQTVTEAEKNRRRISIEELLGLSIALKTELTMLVYPSPDDAPYGIVALPNGRRISVANAFRLSDARFPKETAQPGEEG
jgi:transcriptional regulator with XRE-family HTH domain